MPALRSLFFTFRSSSVTYETPCLKKSPHGDKHPLGQTVEFSHITANIKNKKLLLTGYYHTFGRHLLLPMILHKKFAQTVSWQQPNFAYITETHSRYTRTILSFHINSHTSYSSRFQSTRIGLQKNYSTLFYCYHLNWPNSRFFTLKGFTLLCLVYRDLLCYRVLCDER